MPKHVVFVLDTSGSMQGKKMAQTKSAMNTILSELRKGEDSMSLINFSDEVRVWDVDGVVVDVTQSTVEKALEHVEALDPKGCVLYIFRVQFGV